MEKCGALELLGLLFVVIVTVLDSGVEGQRSTRWREGDLRLVGGRSPNEGTVLIFHWSRWGSICDDHWDIRDATVVCNEMGFPGAREAVGRSRFGKGRRRVWLSGLHCRGRERHVTMCYSRGWGRVLRRCGRYYTSAGVICNPKTTTSTTTTTTKPTTTRSRTTQPPTTTPTTTTPKPTTTSTTTTPRPTTPEPTTREPTTKRPSTPEPTTQKPTTPEPTTPEPTTPKPTTPKPTTPEPTTPKPTTPEPTTPKPTTPEPTTPKPTTPEPTTPKPTTPEPTTPKTTRRPSTTTTTRRPTTSPRRYDTWIYDRDSWRYYMYFRDGSHVTSRPDPRYYRYRNRATTRSPPTTTTTTTTSTTTTTTTRKPPTTEKDNSLSNVIGGDNSNTRNTGNSVINDLAQQNVVQTPREHTTRHRSRHHHDKKAGLLSDQPQGEGTEPREEKEVNTIPGAGRRKTPPTTVGPTAPDYIEYRLKGGRKYTGYTEGRLEVRLPGKLEWGVICGDHWDFKAAIVACRHLGVGYARTAQKTDYYGGSGMKKMLATIKCTGKEDRLEDCSTSATEETPGKEVCSTARSVAGVICDTRLPDLEPDIQTLEYSAFLQDRYLYYLQCALEEQCLSSSANDLYHSRGWTTLTRRLMRFSTVAKNIGTADFRPVVDPRSWEWHACHQHYHSMESFSHYDVIDKNGNKVAEGLKASFCLEDTECSRGVQPKYNCQNWGQQGISVGCQDSYLADIDCQWIDITDVQPGTYTLKVELNPNLAIPELNYDNNVARCTLYYTSTSIRIYDCRLDSLL